MDISGLTTANEAMRSIAQSGAFLVTKQNVMTIGWCMTGIMWKKSVCMAPVRISRFTHTILEKCKEFIVCVPFAGQMEDELEFCGSKSGRDINKIKDLEFSMIPAAELSIPVIGGCEYYIECKVVADTDLALARVNYQVANAYYPNEDPHTLFFGEIVAAYHKNNVIS